MSINNIISNSTVPDDSLKKYDALCKQLLAERIILSWIMKSTMEEFRNISVQDIAEKYICGEPEVATMLVLPEEPLTAKISTVGMEDVSEKEGTISFDIRFKALLPDIHETAALIINVEAQNDFYPGYPLPKRAVYYCGRMISSQYGTVFTKSHYEKLEKVYSIWICLNPPKYRENTITSYSLTENNIIGDVHEVPQYYDLINITMICLGSVTESKDNSLLKLLDVLLSNQTNGEETKRILENDFNIPVTERLEKRRNEMCNLSEGILNRGIEQGIEQGILFALTGLLKNNHTLSEKDAIAMLGIPSAEHSKYLELLATQK